MGKCAATNCDKQVPSHMLMCRYDWFRVSKPTQHFVYQTWANGDIPDIAAYETARQAAIEEATR